jgi:hypothetical protein
VGIPHFLGTEGRDFELQGMKEISRAQNALTLQDRQNIRDRHEKALLGADVSGVPDPSQAVSAVSYKFVKDIQAHLGDHLIRRTINSLKPDGSKINDKLPPLIRHPIPIILSGDELSALHTELKRLADEYVSYDHLDFWPHLFPG